MSVAKEDSTEAVSIEESTQAGVDGTKKADGKFQGDGYTVDFVLDNEWESGFNATVTITNISDVKIDNWSLKMSFYVDFRL